MKVKILGTDYNITYKDDDVVCEDMDCAPGECGGYCNEFSQVIIVANLNLCKDNEATKKILRERNLRHEIIHAFLNESGLSNNSNNICCWAKNEEMVDWIAIQFPKILKVFKEVGCL